ncbi:MAG: ABC transporter permease, partial [Pyrinomonadaceae bacterium]
PDLVSALKDEGNLSGLRERWFNPRKLLLISQVAMSFVVLVGAGLFVRSLRNLYGVDTGFKTDQIALINLQLETGKSKKSLEMFGFFATTEEKTKDAQAEYTALRERQLQIMKQVESVPGVKSVSGAFISPLSGSSMTWDVASGDNENNQDSYIPVDANVVWPEYHQIMGIDLVEGRGFNIHDQEGAAKVAIINEALAKRLYPGQNALGKRICQGPSDCFEIVGVARNSKYFKLTEEPLLHFDVQALQFSSVPPSLTLHIRTAGKAQDLLPTIQREIKSTISGVSITSTMTLSERLNGSIKTTRMATTLTGILGLLALILAAVGLYGTTAYSANRRTREIGIRIALGAQRLDVLKLIIRQGISVTLIGIFIGLAMAVVVTRFAASFLFRVGATDLLTYISVTLL